MISSSFIKKEKRDWNMEIFDFFFKDMKNKRNIKRIEERTDS